MAIVNSCPAHREAKEGAAETTTEELKTEEAAAAVTAIDEAREDMVVNAARPPAQTIRKFVRNLLA